MKADKACLIHTRTPRRSGLTLPCRAAKVALYDPAARERRGGTLKAAGGQDQRAFKIKVDSASFSFSAALLARAWT